MMKLNDLQAIIISKASQHPDGPAEPPDSLPPAPRGAVAKRLLEAALVEIAYSTQQQNPGLAWKLDGQAVFLCITPAGLAAIGVEAEADDSIAQAAQEAPLAASGAEVGDTTAEAAEPAQDAPTFARVFWSALQKTSPCGNCGPAASKRSSAWRAENIGSGRIPRSVT